MIEVKELTGRQLDAEIDRLVFEWRVEEVLPSYPGQFARGDADGNFAGFVPNYSTDIAAAWGIVERLGEMFDDVFVAHIKDQQYAWEVECSDKHDNPSPRQAVYGCAETPAVAICKAGLTAFSSTPATTRAAPPEVG